MCECVYIAGAWKKYFLQQGGAVQKTLKTTDLEQTAINVWFSL